MTVSVVNGRFYADDLSFSGWSSSEIDSMRVMLANVYGTTHGKILLDKIPDVAPITGVDIIKENSGNSELLPKCWTGLGVI